MFNEIFEKVLNKENLSLAQIRFVMGEIMDGNLSNVQIAGFLSALRVKEETEIELLGCAEIMREKSERIILPYPTLDTCGTGGDGKDTYNISTLVSIISAAAGVKVLKHGNRSVSGSCGSADILEELGVNINFTPKEVEAMVNHTGIGFAFAPNFHKSMKNVVPTRKELGTRTIFNILGPLSNPGFSEYQILGVYDKTLMEKMANVLIKLGVKRGLVVHGKDGMDEITLTDTTYAIEINNGKLKEYVINPEDYGFDLCTLEEITGGSKEINKTIMLDILKGKHGPTRDIALLNGGVALYIANKAKTIEEGINICKSIIDSGDALKKLNEFIKESRRYHVS